MTITFNEDLIIGGVVPENTPIRFSDILKIGVSGSSPTPSWQDIVLSGNGSLTLANAKANGLNYLKLFGGCEQRNVPAGYKELTGITMDNNCLYQITGFKLRGSDTVRISFSINAACNVFGCYQGTDANDNYDLYVSTTSNSKYLRYGNGTYLSYWSSSNLGQRFDVVFAPTGTSGMPQDSTWTEMNFESANDMLIGSTTLTGTSAKLKGSVFGHIFVDGRLELIPVERLSDNQICYYDKVSGTVYEPTGTTPVSLGYATPTPAIPIDIVCNNGTIKYFSDNLTNSTIDGQGTFVSPSAATTTRIYKVFGKLQAGRYKVKTSSDFQFILQYKDTLDMSYTQYGNIGTWVTEGEYVLDNPDYYYGIAIRNSDNSTIVPADFNGTISLKYVGTKAYGTTETVTDSLNNTATAQMLLAIDTAKDEQEILTGAITRNVGVKVLDGTETIGTSNSTYTVGITGKTNTKTTLLCSHFPYSNKTSSQTDDLTIISFASNNIGFRYDACATKEAFAQWLASEYQAGHPVTVIYPLATATTETVTGQHLTTKSGTNSIQITQASINNLPLTASYKGTV